MAKIIKESDFEDFRPDTRKSLIYLKMIGLGPETLQLENAQIIKRVSGCPGFYIECDNLRIEMHAYVDRMIDLMETL